MKKVCIFAISIAVMMVTSCDNRIADAYLNPCDITGWRNRLGALQDSTVIRRMADVSGTVCEQIVADCEIGAYRSISIGCLHTDDSTGVATFDMNFFREATVSAITFGGSEIPRHTLDSIRMSIIADKSALVPVVTAIDKRLEYVVWRSKVIWARHQVQGACSTCIPVTP